VTVAKSLQNFGGDRRLLNIGAKLVIDASERSNDECGDGTTTASLIAGYIISEGSRIL
jgi:chaperonin GroEL